MDCVIVDSERKKMAKRLGRKRLSVDIPDNMHEEIKRRTKIRNITITRWILRACYARLKTENISRE